MLDVLIKTDYVNFDGITGDKNGAIYVSSWSKDWQKSVLLKLENNRIEHLLENTWGMADISYLPHNNTLAIACFLTNQIYFYSL